MLQRHKIEFSKVFYLLKSLRTKLDEVGYDVGITEPPHNNHFNLAHKAINKIQNNCELSSEFCIITIESFDESAELFLRTIPSLDLPDANRTVKALIYQAFTRLSTERKSNLQS